MCCCFFTFRIYCTLLMILYFTDDLVVYYHCMKRVQIRSFSEYGDLRSKSRYLGRMRKNKDQKKLRIWTLFMQGIVLFAVDIVFLKLEKSNEYYSKKKKKKKKKAVFSLNEENRYNLQDHTDLTI